jgi:hypothetical protein
MKAEQPPQELSFDGAKALYARHRGRTDDAAVRAFFDIAAVAECKQSGWAKLRLDVLRELGRFLIRNGRPPGRPAKTSDADNLQTLVGLGITDRHISADAKKVARISHRDYAAYFEQEDEPTLAGLLRFGEHTRIGQPYPKMGLGAFGKAMYPQNAVSSATMIDFETSTTEWYAPPELFTAMETRFDLDVASPGAHIVPWIPADRHWTKREDGLKQDWNPKDYVWMNCPYGLRNGCEDWVAKFVEHGNGVAILPDFTSTQWWHTATRDADAIMFVRPKVYFLPKREDGRTNSLGSTLVAMGERGVQALRNAERNERGLCFQRDVGADWSRMFQAAE